MAYIRLQSGKVHYVSAIAGAKIWEVLNGERTGTAEEQNYCLKIKDIYLSRYNAPSSYLSKYKYRLPKETVIPVPVQARLPYKD